MTSWNSYPKVYNLGHANVCGIFIHGDKRLKLMAEEKVDGSQFSFGFFDGKLRVRSKGREFDPAAPDKMFEQAIKTVDKIAHRLRGGWTYRAEYLRKPKHNALAYDRVPKDHLILFDVCTGEEQYLDMSSRAEEAARIGLESVPFLGWVGSVKEIEPLLEATSVLGGKKIEGVVVKRYNRFGKDGKAMMAKFVSERFREIHSNNWKKQNPGGKDIVGKLVDKYGRSEARWHKAVQHLRDDDRLQEGPEDIGNLMKEVVLDTQLECENEIKQDLWDWAWPKIRRSVGRGLPEWYKEKLLEAVK